MALSREQKNERSEFLENNLEITECSQNEKYVFISYASDNWETVFKDAVVPLQKDYGMRVYADKAFDKENDKWIILMLRNILGADAVIAFVSQSYIESYACFLELLIAVNNNVPIVFVSLEDKLKLGDTNAKPDIESGAKNCIIQQGDVLATKTISTSNDIMRAMKSAYTILSTFLKQDVLSKYDISSAFISFFRDAAVNKKTLNDLEALMCTVQSVSRDVFDEAAVKMPEAAVQPAPADSAVSPLNAGESSLGMDAIKKDDEIISMTYTGESENGSPNGKGSCTFGENPFGYLKFEGLWENGELKSGKLTMTDRDDDGKASGTIVYEGEFVNNKINGQGTQTYYDVNGKVSLFYDGELIDGESNGYGKCTWYDENEKVTSVYDGEWKDDIFNGHGKKTEYDKNGSVIYVYEGEWKQNKKNGHGIETKFNNDGSVSYKYDGAWERDVKTGHGTETTYFNDGSVSYVYDGNWENDKKNGQGKKSRYNNQNRKISDYEGGYKDNNFHGQGKSIKYDETGNVAEVKDGEWRNGSFVS